MPIPYPGSIATQDSNLDLPRSERGVLPLDEVAADQAGFEPTACGFGGRRPSHAGLWSRKAHGTGGNRTHDLRVMSPASCPLLHGAAIVPPGLEPGTFAVSERRADQLRHGTSTRWDSNPLPPACRAGAPAS